MNLTLLEARFAENFARHGELGASVCVWRGGSEVVSLAGGWRDREKTRPWNEATPVLFWSATKGLAAACVLHALHARGLDPQVTRVAEVWPEFAQAGKDRVTLAQLLSHQAGLAALSEPVEVWDYPRIVAALAAEPPHWPPGEGHGYHPRTFGFLVDEVIRRLVGLPLREYWRRHFAEPFDLQLWIGVPPEMVEQVAPVFSARTAPPPDDLFYREFLRTGSFTARAFTSPRGLHSAHALNQPAALTAGFPGFGGVGTARGLAKFYAHLLAQPWLAWATHTQTQGRDRVLHLDTALSCGFMRDPVEGGRKTRAIFGPSLRAFGHPGAGGSHAFADPDHGLAFAYVMNQMEPGVLPNAKALHLVEAMYAAG
jgi:CubicO group peptidase (beta-lactamase class C family)